MRSEVELKKGDYTKHETTVHSIAFLEQPNFMFQHLPGLEDYPDRLYTKENPFCAEPAFFSAKAARATRVETNDDVNDDHDVLLPVAEKYKQLGVYAEALLAWMIRNRPRTKLLANGLQVKKGKRTIGEFDFVFRESNGKVVHLELAIKYYLGVGSGAGSKLSHWVGPNTRDRLDIKVNKLVKQQARLAETDAGKLALNELGVDTAAVEARIFLKGELYRKWGDEDMEFPQGYNEPTREKVWIDIQGLDRLSPPSECVWLVVERMDWMAASCEPQFAGEGVSKDDLLAELEERFAAGRGPQRVIGYYRESAGSPCQVEFDGFVVPLWWEEAALASSMRGSGN